MCGNNRPTTLNEKPIGDIDRSDSGVESDTQIGREPNSQVAEREL